MKILYKFLQKKRKKKKMILYKIYMYLKKIIILNNKNLILFDGIISKYWKIKVNLYNSESIDKVENEIFKILCKSSLEKYLL